jgi:hypothetical protein
VSQRAILGPRPGRRLWAVALAAVLCLGAASRGAGPAASPAPATLDPRAQAAFESYVARATAAFDARMSGPAVLWALEDASRTRALAAGEIVADVGDEDGILDVPGGLIHHYVAAVFLPGVPLSAVLARERDYAAYPRIYAPVVEAELLGESGETDRIRLRLAQRTRFVGAVLDTWWRRRHGHPRADLAFVVSATERIQQVEDAGTATEHRLPPGEGGGYLWMAASFYTLLERDGGTYVEFRTIGLSREFPRFLGWIAGPIARRIGRGSVERTLEELRASLIDTP